jgi:hypothetical protein
MKKFVTFVMILGLGLFCAIGCEKPRSEPPRQPVPVNTPEKEKKVDSAKPGAPAPEKSAPEKSAPTKADEKK